MKIINGRHIYIEALDKDRKPHRHTLPYVLNIQGVEMLRLEEEIKNLKVTVKMLVGIVSPQTLEETN